MPILAGHAGIFDADDLNGLAADSAVPTIAIGLNSTTQSTAAQRALLKKARKNGHSAILLDGSNDNYDFGDIFDLGTNNLIVFAVAKMTTGCLIAKGLAGSVVGRWAMGNFSGFTALYQGVYSTNLAANTGLSADTDFHLYEMHINRISGALKTFRDGVLIDSAAFSPDVGANADTPQNLFVGSYDGTNNPFSGEIAYIVPYLRSTEFSSAELTQNRNELGSRFLLDYYAPFSFVTTSPLPNAILGVPYTATIQTAGGTGTLSLAITADTNSTGVSINPTTGVLSMPAQTTSGAKSFQVTATRGTESQTQTFVVTVLGKRSRIPSRFIATPSSRKQTSAATLTPDGERIALEILTAQTANLTVAKPTGTPSNGDKIAIRVKANSAYTLSFNSAYRGSTDAPLPSTLSGADKTDYFFFEFNAEDAKWDLVNKKQGF